MTERDFDQYLKGDSALSRAYRESAAEMPPASVDAAVMAALNEQRAAVASERRRVRHWHRYLVPMAAAATVMLSFSLVMQLALDSQIETIDLDDIAIATESARKKAAAAEVAAPPAVVAEAGTAAGDPVLAQVPGDAPAESAIAGRQELPVSTRPEDAAVADSPGDRFEQAGGAASGVFAAETADRPEPAARAKAEAITADVGGPETDPDVFAAAPPPAVEQDGEAVTGDLEQANNTGTEMDPDIFASAPPPAREQSGAVVTGDREQADEAGVETDPDIFASAPPPSLEQIGAADTADAEYTEQADQAGDAPATGFAMAAEPVRTITSARCAGVAKAAGEDPIDNQVAQARCLIEAGDFAGAGVVIEALIAAEPAFDLEAYPDLKAALEER